VNTGYSAPRISDGRRSAPRYAIEREQLEFLLSLGMTTPQIGQILNVSKATVKRRLRYAKK